MRSSNLAGIVVVACVVAAAPAAAGDLILRQRVTTSGPHSHTEESAQYFSGSRHVTDSPDMRVIIDLDTETMTMADKEKRTYYSETFAAMRQRADDMQAEMQKRMADLPPQAREMMGKMGMGAKGTEVPVSVKATGKTEKIAGYETKEYAVDAGGMRGSVWATEELQPPGGDKAREAYTKMAGKAGPGANLAQALAGIPGVPLRMTMGGNMGPHGFSTTTEVFEVREESPPDDVMQVPAGFTKTEPPRFDGIPNGKGPRAR